MCRVKSYNIAYEKPMGKPVSHHHSVNNFEKEILSYIARKTILERYKEI